ncbi:Hypothetical protein MBVG_1210 [Mycoplasmopsis bovigenitalium 51080]|uniref:DUF4116 domain-containing protein n=1 Tax=Mycoplasmopsis bovigenitalium 51080 TaxID=1188235 RepID=N9TVW0_9BACT|nr:DUF4116 domain-containing protein [Mycoplasmopsis bovigenitalium]ENY70249.1 Hypothetical protein MBVG_1210 [Mycoplasmopsis bovigenitalium 51080]
MNKKYKEIKISYSSVEDFYNDIEIKTADSFVLKPQALELLKQFLLQNEYLYFEAKGELYGAHQNPIFGFKTNKDSKKEFLNNFILHTKKINNLKGKFNVEDLETAIKKGVLSVKDWKNASFWVWAIKNNPKYMQNTPKELTNDKEFLLRIIDRRPEVLEYVSDELKSDKEFILAALLIESQCLKYASKELKTDKEVIICAIDSHTRFINSDWYHLSKDDTDIILNAVNEDASTIQYACDEIKNDRKFMLDAIDYNIYILKYLPQHFKNDKELVLKAINIEGLALEFASKELKNDKEVVLKAIDNSFGEAFAYASNKLKRDKTVLLQALKWNEELSELIPEELKMTEILF